jgi:quercetin dioxygenase-like cupin family protein
VSPSGLAISAPQATAPGRQGEHRQAWAQQPQLRTARGTRKRRPLGHAGDPVATRNWAQLHLPPRTPTLSAFDDLVSIAPQQIWERIAARSLHGERITLAVVELDPGAVVAEHSHENEQLGILIRGALDFRIGDGRRELGPGETWNIPANTPHEAIAGPEGAVVIDVFSPPRDDIRELPKLEQRPPRWPEA